MDKTGIGDRMKSQYEHRTRQYLPRRTNTIIRLDGKAFHTYTKGLDKPFDEGFMEDMQQAAIALCEEIQGAKCAYCQSDEISVLSTDYDTINTDAYFDGNLQKITSVTAATATAAFLQARLRRGLIDKQREFYENIDLDIKIANEKGGRKNKSKAPQLMQRSFNDLLLPTFDSRAFTIADKEEVVNNFIWRQQDAERNSIQMLAQSLYSHNELHKKNTSMLQDMCFDKGHNWNDLHFSKKRGSLILRNTYVDGVILSKYTDIVAPYIPFPIGPKVLGEVFRAGNRYFQVGVHENFPKELNWLELNSPEIRTKWEVVDTPIFTKDRDIIKNLMPTI